MSSTQYNQTQAMLAITKASLRSIFRSPSAVIFSFGFPLIFILVFGFLGGSGKLNLKVAFEQGIDKTNQLYTVLNNVEGIVVVNKEEKLIREDLEKGRITAVINILPGKDSLTRYSVSLKTSEATSPQNVQVLKSLLEGIIKSINEKVMPPQATYAEIRKDVITVPGRTYRTIDFILPGQLGFSLLSAGIFGVAFVFFNLRQTLVLKRFFATPIRRSYIVFGEGIARVIFQLTTAVVILLVGHFAFKFTLVHGWVTFLELLVLSLVGLLVFMGFGFIVSGVAKNESSIPPFANLITMPQFLLAGTFFSIDNFPGWLQPLCKILPLTHLNDAMRNVAFEGDHLTDCGPQLGILLAWTVVVYAIAIKVFRWE